MEEKIVTVDAVNADNGKIYVTAEEISRKLGEGMYKKGSLIDKVYPKTNVIKINRMNPFDGEYTDSPGNEIYDEDEDFLEYTEGFLKKISNCILDGTGIIGVRKNRGFRR